MAYIRYEELPSKVIGSRVIPALRKYYRADGTFDLFFWQEAPMQLKALANAGYVDVYCGHGTIDDRQMGRYHIANLSQNKSSLTYLEVGVSRSSGGYGEVASTCRLAVRLDNPYNLVPWRMYSYSSQGGKGWAWKDFIKIKWDGTIEQQRENKSGTTYDIYDLYDYKEYQLIEIISKADDNGKYNSANTLLSSIFKRRVTTSDPIYHYYT